MFGLTVKGETEFAIAKQTMTKCACGIEETRRNLIENRKSNKREF